MTNKMLTLLMLCLALWTTAAHSNPVVVLATNFGDIEITLNPERAPVTVENFLAYVDDGFYDGLIFHRVIPRFMIQTGGFDKNMREQRNKRPPIKNESANRLHNDRYTVAMARTNDPDSATSQFFINVRTNGSLDYARGKPGYAVFGEVTAGKDSVYAISIQPTATAQGKTLQGMTVPFQDVPVEPIVITKAYRKTNQ